MPFRDSKLTPLLKDSLGGNCHTMMIANISPSGLAYKDTYNTLKCADWAKEIRLTLKRVWSPWIVTSAMLPPSVSSYRPRWPP